MGASKCYSLMKCLLIFLNIVFLCIGVLFCGLGLWAAAWGTAAGAGAGAGGSKGALGAGAVGAWGGVLALGGAVGVGGAAAHSAPALAASLLLSALAATAEGGAVWLVLTHSDSLRGALREHLRHLILTQYYSSRPAADVIDAIQHGLQCCGAESMREWERAGAGAGGAGGGGAEDTFIDLRVRAPPPAYSVPASCCRTLDAAACETARVGVGVAGGGASPALSARPCAPLVLHHLQQPAHVGMYAGAVLLGCHALSLLLTIGLLLYPAPRHLYKA